MSEQPFANGLADYPFAYCDSVLVTRNPNKGGEAEPFVRGATGTLLRINDRLRLVTMKHVLDAYRSERANDRRTKFSFAGLEFDPERTLVGESDVADLAIFNTVGANFTRNAPHLPPLEYFIPTEWPQRRVTIGSRVFLGGWPEEYREIRDGGREVFSKPEALVGVEVTDVQREQFVCTLDRTNWTASNKRAGYLKEPIGSGFSGSPVFVERTVHGEFAPELVGFLKGTWEKYDTIVLTFADFIHVDGLLN